jgi:Aspartyl protease
MPDLPIVLCHETHSLPAVALVDSGASISVLPYSLGVQFGFDWQTQTAHITLAGTLAHIGARGIVVEAAVGQLAPVRLALAWAISDQVPFLLGQFNFFQAFDVCFFRTRGIFEIRQPGAAKSP